MRSLQVTRGVRITATPLFVPEHSKLQSEGSPRPTYFFAYWSALLHLTCSNAIAIPCRHQQWR